ncbi:MAG: hypothetical protein ACTSQE_16080 [Candidatus Heimdallarchaeaceae archaeon]
MKKSSIIIDTGIQSLSYTDAVILKVHEDSYDVQLSNGKNFLYVQNVSSFKFNSGDYVAVLFSDKDQSNCRIIGKGKRLSTKSQILEVLV